MSSFKVLVELSKHLAFLSLQMHHIRQRNHLLHNRTSRMPSHPPTCEQIHHLTRHDPMQLKLVKTSMPKSASNLAVKKKMINRLSNTTPPLPYSSCANYYALGFSREWKSNRKKPPAWAPWCVRYSSKETLHKLTWLTLCRTTSYRTCPFWNGTNEYGPCSHERPYKSTIEQKRIRGYLLPNPGLNEQR